MTSKKQAAIWQHMEKISPGYIENQKRCIKTYNKSVKFDEFGRADISSIGKVANSSNLGIKIDFSYKSIKIRSAFEQKFYEFFQKIIEILKKNALSMIVSMIDLSISGLIDLHEKMESKQKEYLGYDEQFVSTYSEEDLKEFVKYASSAIKKNPTYAAIMGQFGISKRQAGKVRKMILDLKN